MKKIKVVISWSPNFAPLANVCLESIKDEGIEVIQNVFNLTETNYGFQKPSWYEAARLKLEFLLSVLEKTPEGERLVFSDADIQYFQPKLLIELVGLAARKKIEYFGTTEPNRKIYNCGFYIIQNCEKIKKMLQQTVLRVEKEKPSFAEQDIINTLLDEMEVSHKHIPESYYCLGNQPLYLYQCFHHAIVANTVADKIQQMRCNYIDYYTRYYNTHENRYGNEYGKLCKHGGITIECRKGMLDLYDPTLLATDSILAANK